MQPADAIAILPETILTAAGIVAILLGAFLERSGDRAAAAVTYAGLIGAIAAVVMQFSHRAAAFGGVFLADSFSSFFRLLFLLIGLLVVLSSSTYLRREALPAAEFYGLVLFGTVGMNVMASANELILVFIGLEISSLASYVLVGFRRDVATSSEASLKYFLLGSFATAFFLYGIALMFGSTGSTRLTEISSLLNTVMRAQAPGIPIHPAAANLPAGSVFPASLVGVSIALMFVGLGFKVSAAPFQIWTPDVYQGAPTPVAAFLSTAPKAAAFAAFLRIFVAGLGAYAERWSLLLWMAAVLSMLVGNLAALLQTNIKRMLAYSAIAHAGYVLVAFTAHSGDGVAAVLYYLAAYALMNIGAFLVVTQIGGPGEKYLEIEDYAGLGFRYPFLAGMFSIFLLSLIGVPLTAGFLGKFYIFRAALHGNLIWLTVLGVLNSGIAAYYYLRVLVSMYMSEPTRDIPCEPLRAPERLALAISVAGTIYLGLYPRNVMDLAAQAAQWLQPAP